jgi:hypothetical protein
VAALVDVLKRRLEPHFDMKWETDIFMEWKEIKDDTATLGKRDRLVSWTIEVVRVRTERLEREELKNMPKAIGCTVVALRDAYRDVSAPTKQGPATEEWKPDRMSKLLKKRGHPKATPSVLRRWLHLSRKYSPELFPQPESPKAPTNREDVVPFKRDRPKPAD